MTGLVDVHQFPGLARPYEVSMGSDLFELTFESSSAMVARGVQGPNRGFREREEVTITPLRNELFLVSWQEASGTTAVLVADFASGLAHTHITIPDDDGTVFLRFEGTLKPVS